MPRRGFDFHRLRSVLLLAGLCLSVIAVPAAGEAADGRACEAEPTDEVIAYGDLVTCAILPVGDTDTFRFVGRPNEKVVIQATAGPQFILPCVELYGPDGALLARTCNNSFTNRIDATLRQAGIHTILVRDFNNSRSATYQLALERVGPLAPFGTTIKYGETVASRLDLPGDFDALVFTGTRTTRISAQASSTGDFLLPCIELFGPDGGLVAKSCENSFTNRIDASLTQDGSHTLLVSDFTGSRAATYSVTLQCLVGSCADALATALGAEVSPPALSAPVGAPAVATATITNQGAAVDLNADDAETADTAPVDALSCGIVQLTGVPTQFSYQAKHPTTDQLIGSPNTPANLRPGESQKFQISLTPTAAFCPTNVTFGFSCSNAGFADVLTGVNTLLLTGGSPAACGLRASATVNRSSFAVGQTVVAGASASNSGLAGTFADIYVGILRPDGAIEFLTSAGVVVGNGANPGSFRPLAVNVSLSAPFSVSQPNVISRQRTAGDPPGAYVFFVAAVRTGALDQILSLATAPYTFP